MATLTTAGGGKYFWSVRVGHLSLDIPKLFLPLGVPQGTGGPEGGRGVGAYRHFRFQAVDWVLLRRASASGMGGRGSAVLLLSGEGGYLYPGTVPAADACRVLGPCLGRPGFRLRGGGGGR